MRRASTVAGSGVRRERCARGRPAPTLSTARFQIERLGQLLVDETEVTVEVEICAVDVGKKLKAKSKPRTRKQLEAEETFRELKLEVKQEWTAAGSTHRGSNPRPAAPPLLILCSRPRVDSSC